MTIDITSFFFNSSIEGATATSAWGTSIGQSKSKECRIEDEKPGVLELLTGMLYKSVADKSRVDLSAGSQNREVLLCSLFDKIYINNQLLEGQSFALILVRERSKSHDGRLLISYPPYALVDGQPINQSAIEAMSTKIGCSSNGCWFVHDISIRNQDELHFSSIVVDKDKPKIYTGTSRQRSEEWNNLVEIKREYTLEELGAILKDMYDNAESGKQIAMIYIFVFKYGEHLVDIYKSSEIIAAAGLNASYSTEVDKAYNIYRFASKKRYILPGQSLKSSFNLPSSKQTIFFGSPGTGKSWTVQNDILDGVKDDFIFRTTFHPDTDYSAFVGCYKPVMRKLSPAHQPDTINDYKELVDTLKEYLARKYINWNNQKNYTNITTACALFGYDFHDSIIKMESSGEHSIVDLVSDAHMPGTTYDSVLRAGMRIYQESSNQSLNSEISYSFVPQVFTEAYVKAWQNPTEQVYLVIEEINRGNCAQIFGDLFQLLDRKKGVSEYPVKAETALAEYLSNVLEGDAAEGIREGKLSLPANLNIIATMNTSDQSLFPMDSAFKRRWDWKYIPTTPPADKSRTMELSFKDKTTTKYGTTIDAGDYEYDWTEFLEKINEKIQNATHSDDKQLGFWFVKTEEGAEEITISSFVSKVVFYLWNDVFRDMGAKDSNPFTIKVDGKNVVMSFNSFFEMNSSGQIVENIGVLHTFLRNVGVEPKVKKAIADAQDAAQAKEMTEEA